MSIVVSVRILSLFDLIHFLIFFNIAGAPPFATGGFHLCMAKSYWCESHENAQECDVLFIINLN